MISTQMGTFIETFDKNVNYRIDLHANVKRFKTREKCK